MVLKICGVRDLSGAQACREAGVRFAGLNLVEGSRRRVRVGALPALVAALGEVEPVAVLRDPPPELVEAAAGAGIRWMQVHGEAPPDFSASLRALGLRVIRALPGTAPAERLRKHARVADLLLLDGPDPGSGRPWAWSELAARPAVPLLVAGGLHPGNVGEVIAALRPDGVDVASGIEREGRMDPARVAAFCRAARAAFAKLQSSERGPARGGAQA